MHPDPAEVARRAQQPSTRLWERRPGHDDWLALRVGTGPVPWDVPLAGGQSATRHADVVTAVAEVATLADCPVTVELAGGGVVGVVGSRPAAVAVARWLLVQAAVHHGPADLPVLVACDRPVVDDWDWAKWLPHVTDPSGAGRRLAAGRADADALADAILEAARERDRMRQPGEGRSVGPTLLAVVDGDALLEGRRAPLRNLLTGAAGPVAGIVVAPTVDRLPSVCTAVVRLDGEHGDAELRLPALGRRLAAVRAAGLAEPTARRSARALARFDDPELDGGGAGLPDTVRLLPLLALDDPDPEQLRRRWAAAGPDPRPTAPLGIAADGVLELDLVADGPHGLVAGTTGAGKSELLRTLVAGLAAGADPDHLTFVLVDFKGGSAFDACARLPHTVGLVTDLDADLAERALRCLEAELRHRERLLRAVGAADLTGYRQAGRPRRAVAAARRRGRRVRHAQGRAPRLRRRPRRHRPAGPQPRRPPRARHPAAGRRRVGSPARQRQPPHRAAGAGRGRLDRRRRRSRRRRPAAAPSRPGVRPPRPGRGRHGADRARDGVGFGDALRRSSCARSPSDQEQDRRARPAAEPTDRPISSSSSTRASTPGRPPGARSRVGRGPTRCRRCRPARPRRRDGLASERCARRRRFVPRRRRRGRRPGPAAPGAGRVAPRRRQPRHLRRRRQRYHHVAAGRGGHARRLEVPRGAAPLRPGSRRRRAGRARRPPALRRRRRRGRPGATDPPRAPPPRRARAAKGDAGPGAGAAARHRRAPRRRRRLPRLVSTTSRGSRSSSPSSASSPTAPRSGSAAPSPPTGAGACAARSPPSSANAGSTGWPTRSRPASSVCRRRLPDLPPGRFVDAVTGLVAHVAVPDGGLGRSGRLGRGPLGRAPRRPGPGAHPADRGRLAGARRAHHAGAGSAVVGPHRDRRRRPRDRRLVAVGGRPRPRRRSGPVRADDGARGNRRSGPGRRTGRARARRRRATLVARRGAGCASGDVGRRGRRPRRRGAGRCRRSC